MSERDQKVAAHLLVMQARAALSGALALIEAGNWPDPWSQDKAKSAAKCAIEDCEVLTGRLTE